MNCLDNDLVYQKILKKFEDGEYERGNNCPMKRYYFENKNIHDFSLEERTPEVCSSLMDYSKCKFSDVPEKSRTRNFFIHSFTDNDVFNYIKNNITKFDRQFFKDLIENNEYSCHLINRCFNIMPLDYIDEEMCYLALINNTGWSQGDWIFDVYKKNPDALTEDVWKLAARLYARVSKYGTSRLVNMTPEEYKDQEYYKELCSCNFNCGMSLPNNKGKIMDLVPDEYITKEFIFNLLSDDKYAIARFSNEALEKKINISGVTKSLWKHILDHNGYLISYIDLNDEKIDYFLSKYGKDTSEYNISFKDRYKKYKKEKENLDKEQRKKERIKNKNDMNTMLTLLVAYNYAEKGEDSTKAINDIQELDKKKMTTTEYLPIKYKGLVPENLKKQYDKEEYLELIYKKFGINIFEEYDDLFYSVELPEGWTIANDGYWNNVKDMNGDIVFTYFYDSKFYDREAYVKEINTILIPVEEDNNNDNYKKLSSIIED